MQDVEKMVWIFLGSVGCSSGDTGNKPAAERERLTEPATGMDLLRIEASTFHMGCEEAHSEGGCADGPPVTAVTLTHDYYIGQTEVTQAQYRKVMLVDPSISPGCGDLCPVEGLSWHHAAAFANALSAAGGLRACYVCTGLQADPNCVAQSSPYDCDGYRLPTEAEWEGAARCGHDTTFAGSDGPHGYSWGDGDSGGAKHRVRQLHANDCGLYDMSGNVWEWNHDLYASEAVNGEPHVDPWGPAAAELELRVLRGGGYDLDAPVWYRSGAPAVTTAGHLGLRMARTAN